jgi:drug/metabolite transporter (DMT)-like permease
MKENITASIKVFFSFFIWSLLGPILNLSSFTVFQTIWGASVLATLYLILYAYFSKKFAQLKIIKLDLKLLLFLVSSGLSGVLWFYSLTLMPIAQAVLLYSTVPLLTFVLAFFFLKESLQVLKIISLLIGIVGVGIILATNLGKLSFSGIFFFGVVSVLIAASLTAVQAIITKKLSIQYKSWTTVLLIMLSQAIITTPFAFTHQFFITPFAIDSTIFLSIFSSIFAFFFYVDGFRVFRSSTVTLAGYIEPFLAAIWGYFFLHQILTITIALGGILILAAGYIAVRSEERNNTEILPYP